MIVRTLREIAGTERDVNWGNGQSRRFLLEADGMGFAFTETLILAGTDIFIQYRNHLEACYCVEGEGEIQREGGDTHPIAPGTLYALNDHDPHYLRAWTDMRLISVFNPPIKGNERHNLSGDETSSY
ncbi:L-ectoine synthase [Roseibium algicola]|uniref:L-ectoine synthase n=1 Tax=Roseibium algicola TaxID=2857014 RepID=A0ABN4X0X8_9HYPH|nr:ectoine synthase [Roseibium aggregatum]AQQ05375.1 L-ectoine synthase [Roseibium aggregatum]